MPEWNQITEKLKDEIGIDLIASSARRVMGGDINDSYCLKTVDGTEYFIKTNAGEAAFEMFAAEAKALSLVAESNAIRVPKVFFYNRTNRESYLVLEYLLLGAQRDEQKFGRQLAAMHSNTHTEFGWHTNNTIGSTIQINTPSVNWCEFWIDNRLTPQLNLAKANGCDASLLELGQQLIERSPLFFTSHEPQASMLHGDLWAGNAACLLDGTPVIYDPAFYYGDREVDLAMMELFGGFSADCFSAYFESAPIDQHGYAQRKHYYNLYHLLNHFNLFGGGYQIRCVDVMQRLLAEL